MLLGGISWECVKYLEDSQFLSPKELHWWERQIKIKKKGKLWYPLWPVQFSRSVMSDWTPWTAAHQASLSITSSLSLFKPMPIKSVMPFNHLILCHPLLLPPSIFPSIRVFSNESVFHIRWPKYWSFSFSHQSFQWIFRADFL